MSAESFSHQVISSFNEIQGGATFFPDGTPGYVIYLRDRNGNLQAPIYLEDKDYGKMGAIVEVEGRSVRLALLPTKPEFPEQGYVGKLVEENTLS